MGGNPLNEWDEYIGEFYTRYESTLHWANGRIYLISHGIPAPPEYDCSGGAVRKKLT